MKNIKRILRKQHTTSDESRLPFDVIKEKYGKGPTVKSTKELTAFLNKKGYKSLSKLIDAK